MGTRSWGGAHGRGAQWGLVVACAAGLLPPLALSPAHAKPASTEPQATRASGAEAGLLARLRGWEQRHLEPIGEWLGKAKLGSFSLDGLTLQLSGGLSLGSVGLGHAQASVDAILSTPKGHVESHLTASSFLSCLAAELAVFPRAPQRRVPAPPPPTGDRAEFALAGAAAAIVPDPLSAGPGEAPAEAGAGEQGSAEAPQRGWLGRGYDKLKRFGFAGVSLGYFIAATEHPQHGAPFAGLVVHQALAIFIGRGKDRGLFGLYIVPFPFLPMSPTFGFIVSHPRLFASERWERWTTKLTETHARYKGRFEDWLKQGPDRLRTFPAAAARTSTRVWNATRRACEGMCAAMRTRGQGGPAPAGAPGGGS